MGEGGGEGRRWQRNTEAGGPQCFPRRGRGTVSRAVLCADTERRGKGRQGGLGGGAGCSPMTPRHSASPITFKAGVRSPIPPVIRWITLGDNYPGRGGDCNELSNITIYPLRVPKWKLLRRRFGTNHLPVASQKSLQGLGIGASRNIILLYTLSGRLPRDATDAGDPHR